MIPRLSGMVRVSFLTPDPASALVRLAALGIEAETIHSPDPFTLEMTVPRRQLPLLQAEKTGLKILGRQGLFWRVSALLHRPILAGGIILGILATLLLPTRVLFLRVEGNRAVPGRLILEQAEQLGLSFGARCRSIRSEPLKNQLLEALPQLQWAGINTRGCMATITVQERSDPPRIPPGPAVSHIVAARDGIVTACIPRQGSVQCRVGQAVRKGQILISGLTDCGLKIRAERAQGEIYARTKRTISVITPGIYGKKDEFSGWKTRYALRFGKKRINLYKDSGISPVSCGKMYTIYDLKLPGGWALPVSLIREQTQTARITHTAAAPEAADALLRQYAEYSLRQQMLAGEILQMDAQVLQTSSIYSLTGRCACREMIGREHPEEIIG